MVGSVKDLTVLERAYENKSGIARFTFSDRYSVFDWGEMPDQIANKGSALAVMAAFNFERLEKVGIKTHYRGLVGPDGKLMRSSDLKEGDNGSNVMQVDMGVVYRPTTRIFLSDGQPKVEYDYSFFDKHRGAINNYLIPLEIIFRNGLPKGSSVFDRIEAAKKIEDPTTRTHELFQIYGKLGLKAEPNPGDMLPKPVMTFTTKLEAGDRSLEYWDALEISGLAKNEFEELNQVALRVNDVISYQASKTGFVHYDGKVEMLYNKGLVVCDVVGTFDEDRFGLKDEQVSKEFLRQWYERNQPDFKKECKKWKETGEGWQERCLVKPIKLEPRLAQLVSQVYMAGCNQYVERRIFDAPDLEKVMDTIRPLR